MSNVMVPVPVERTQQRDRGKPTNALDAHLGAMALVVPPVINALDFVPWARTHLLAQEKQWIVLHVPLADLVRVVHKQTNVQEGAFQDDMAQEA